MKQTSINKMYKIKKAKEKLEKDGAVITKFKRKIKYLIYYSYPNSSVTPHEVFIEDDEKLIKMADELE